MRRLRAITTDDTQGTATRPSGALRHRAIVAALREEGFISVAAIAARFGVSDMTARRDLQQLVLSGVARRTRGGAMALTSLPDDEVCFATRQTENRLAKQAIGETAAALVRAGESIGVDVGSTTLELARALRGRRRIIVFTHSLRVAMALADSSVSTYLPGGQVRGEEMSVGGNVAVTQMQHWRMDAAFLGVSGITPDGVFDFSPEDVAIKRAYRRCAARVIVLADASKFGRFSAMRIGSLTGINTLVTDRSPDGALRDALEAAGVEVIVTDSAARAAA